MNEQMKEYLCHMTDAEKKAYNAEYYRNHKNYWEEYYSKGRTVGRPVGRQKYVTEGNGQGVYRRGEGINNYSEIYSHTTAPKVGTTHRPRTGNTYATDEEMGWQDGFLKDVDENDPRKKLQKEYYEYRKYANVNDRLAKEYKNKANDARKAGYTQRASELEEKAREHEKIKKEEVQGMKRCLEGIKRHQAEIEAHNSHTYEHKPSNKPHGAAVSDIEAFNSAYKKAEKKEKVKKAAKQAASDWKAGAKGISSMAKDSVESGKKAFSKLLSKFR